MQEGKKEEEKTGEKRQNIEQNENKCKHERVIDRHATCKLNLDCNNHV